MQIEEPLMLRNELTKLYNDHKKYWLVISPTGMWIIINAKAEFIIMGEYDYTITGKEIARIFKSSTDIKLGKDTGINRKVEFRMATEDEKWEYIVDTLVGYAEDFYWNRIE